MGDYEDLLNECDKNNIVVVEKCFKSKAKGLWKNNKIGISNKIDTDVEKKCILAEEIGHFKTTTGDITDQTKIENRKQELKARRYSYKILVEPIDFIYAFKNGVKDRYELADFLNITDEVLEEIIIDFKKKYGIGHKVDNYYLALEPGLGIYKYSNKI